MNPETLLLIIKNEKEEFFSDKNNAENNSQILKNNLSFSKLFDDVDPVFWMASTGLNVGIILYITNTFFSTYLPFIQKELMFHLLSLFFLFFISFFFSFLSIKSFFKIFYKNTKAREKMVHNTLENEFNQQPVSDEVFSMIKILLTDDEYFSYMNNKDHITNKQAINIAKNKIKKEKILGGKRELVLDLNKLNKYNINIIQ